MATYSEQADQYTKAGATIGSNVAVSPDGYTNADSIIEDSANSPHAFYNFGLTTFSATAYTLSIFAKKGGRDWIRLSLYDGTAPSAYFNLNTGAIGTTSGVTAKIENYGSGWYRCSVTATMSAVSGGIAVYSASADGIDTYVGTNGLAATYFYGWQLELGAYATSYIPTLGTSVTRVADAAIKTGISSLIGQTEGTLFVDVSGESLQDNSRYMSISDFNDPNKRITIYQASGKINVYCSAGSTFNLDYNPPAGRLKIAFGYKSGQYVLYVNGVNAASSTEAVVQGCSDLGLGVNEYLATANPPAVGYNQALLFKTRLTNAQLAELTTL